MKALILSGGIGKRLKPITDYVPKSLVPINNVPIIEWQIRYFMKFGVKEFVICTGYKSEQIINYLDTKNNFGVKIRYSIEKTSLGTGGAIRHARHFIDEKSFFVINGDIITDLDPTELKSKLNSIAVVPLRTAFGVVNLMEDRVTRFEEKPEISDYWTNAGVYHLSKEIIRYLPKKGNIEDTAFPILAAKGCLRAKKYTNTLWHSIDSHKDLEECKKSVSSRRYKNFIFKK
ncbi:MAG: nucleotidyltransferase family protein [Nitrososphaeraceae archaeon]